MRQFFKELVKGNLPDGFRLEKGNEFFCLYRTNPSKEQIVALNNSDTNSEIVEARWKRIFMRFGYRFNERTKKWER